MRILVDCRPLQVGPINEEKLHFITTCAGILAGNYGVEWFWLADRGLSQDMLQGLPAGTILEQKGWSGRLGTWLWQDRLIPAAAQKNQIDMILTTAEKKVGRKNGKFGKPGKEIPLRHWDWKNWLPGMDDGYAPLDFAGREAAKEKFAGGREYFLARTAGMDGETVIGLLKAFSAFKKRQRSNMQLILVPDGGVFGGDLAGKLETYKFREDVHIYIPEQAEDLVLLTEGSYAYLFLPGAGRLGGDILNAWQAGVPVILAGKAEKWGKLTGSAAAMVVPGDIAAMAGQMMAVYKDEALRNGLIGKGVERVIPFTWEAAAKAVYEDLAGVEPM